MTPENIKLRAGLKKAIRSFFETRNYVEVDTPIIVPCPGTELHLDYFSTEWVDHQSKNHKYYLRSSPELHMKQLLTEETPRIFQFAPSFRNGGELSKWHNPEFTMLEWYQTEIKFEDFISQTEELLHDTISQTKSRLKIPTKLKRITVKEAFKEFAKIDLIDGDNDLSKKAIDQKILSVQKTDDFETAFFKILIERIEPALERLEAVVLRDYPESQAALSKTSGGVAKRFEIYVNRVEICNGFDELLDPELNKKRIKQTLKERRALGKEVTKEDEAFYSALKKGLPSCCGNALGFDRWLALLSGSNDISTSIPFQIFS